MCIVIGGRENLEQMLQTLVLGRETGVAPSDSIQRVFRGAGIRCPRALK